VAVKVGRACIDKCRRMGYEGALYYGMVKEYAETRGWGLWEVFREVVQNALDEMHEVLGYRPTVYPCVYKPEIRGSVVYDTGRGIATYNLYIGKSEKKPWQRGKFGEGLKIALLTAVANGIDVYIHSMDKEFRPVLAKEDVEGVKLDVFCICVKKLPTPITGTQVYFPRAGDLCSGFWNMVVQGIMERSPKSIIISWEVPEERMWRDLIDKRVTNKEGWIFSRDLFVSSFKDATGRDACYSYNLYDLVLDESRRIASMHSVEREVMTFWTDLLKSFDPGMVETDEFHRKAKEALKNVLSCLVKDSNKGNMFESDICIIDPVSVFINRGLQVKLRLLLDEVVGKDVWIIRDRDLSELAKYLGVNHIYCTTPFCSCAQDWFDMREVFMGKIRQQLKAVIPRDKLDPKLRARLEILEAMARELFNPPAGVKVEYMTADPDVKGTVIDTPVEKIILMNVYHLIRDCSRDADTCMRSFFETYGHELAHILSGKGDLTEEHLKELTNLLGLSLSRAISRYERIEQLVRQLYATYSQSP
jgi:hypothetical protein